MKDDKTLARLIRDREESIAAERDTENIILSNLGQALYDAGIVLEDLQEYRSAVDTASEDLRIGEEALRRLLSDEEQRRALSEESKALKVELRNLANRKESVLEDLGRACWDLRKSGRQTDEAMEEALGDLIKADDRLHSAEVAEYRAEGDMSRGKPAFLSRGRALFLAGRRRTATAALDRLWSRAGSRVFENVEPEFLAETAAAAPLATLKALEERGEKIRERQVLISEETGRLDEALEGYPGKGGSRKREVGMEKALSDGRTALDEAYRTLGGSWVENHSEEPMTGDIEKCRKDWLALDGRISSLADEMLAIEAHREYLKLCGLRDAAAGRAERLDKEIKSYQAELRDVKKELKALEKDVAEREEALPPIPGE